MKIRSSLAALAAAFALMFFFSPAANAQEKTDTKKPIDKPAPVMVAVNAGDTLTSIAEAHGTDYVRLFNANDFIANPDIINVGDQVRVPTAEEQLPDRYGTFVAPVINAGTVRPASTASSSARQYAAPTRTTYGSTAGNTYAQGYCTWYAKQRRPDLPNMLGNGGQWVANAAARGYATGSAPRAGAIAEIPGHVAYVESVNADGTMVISEMNGPAGFGVVGTRTVASNQYRFIY